MNRKIWNYLVILFLVVSVSLITDQSWAANFSLEITQPRAGLDTRNRFYKTYPGIEYNVRVAVIGGDFPYNFSLITSPSGMTINSSTGVISWSNPTTVGSPHTVTVRVTDLGASGGGIGTGGSVSTVTWPLTVTTSGFIFIDAVNGSASPAHGGTGTGTLASPFRTIYDFLPNASDSTYGNYFVYFRTGTYDFTNLYTENCGTIDCRIFFYPGFKPQVWLAYPGNSPVIDMGTQGSLNTPSLLFYGEAYLDGLEFRDMGTYGIQVMSSSNNMTFRRLIMHNLGPTPGANNQSFIRVASNAPRGNYMTVEDCTFYNLNHGAAIKFYESNYTLVQNNHIYDFVQGSGIEGIANKGGQRYTTTRENTIHGVEDAINGNNNNNDYSEYLYNNLYNCITDCMTLNQDGISYHMYVYRNTVQGTVTVMQQPAVPYVLTNNVLQNNVGGGVSSAGNSILTGNLTGSNIVDSAGKLTPAYSSFLGKVGQQITGIGSTDISPPSPPQNLSAQ